jgi:predicted small metal-binding protein
LAAVRAAIIPHEQHTDVLSEATGVINNLALAGSVYFCVLQSSPSAKGFDICMACAFAESGLKAMDEVIPKMLHHLIKTHNKPTEAAFLTNALTALLNLCQYGQLLNCCLLPCRFARAHMFIFIAV